MSNVKLTEEDLKLYLDDIMKMSITTLKFKEICKSDTQFLNYINKFQDENNKIIGVINTILLSCNIDKYCNDSIEYIDEQIQRTEPVKSNTYVDPFYIRLSSHKNNRVRSYSDHPRPFPIYDFDTKENKCIDSSFDKNFTPPKFPDLDKLAEEITEIKNNLPKKDELKKDPEVNKAKKFTEIIENKNSKPIKENLNRIVYTTRLPITPKMILKPLDLEFRDFIKNSNDFDDKKFYYYSSDNNEELYLIKKPTDVYYVADDGKFYMLRDNYLIPAEFENKLQRWIKK